jgi:predicted outer membrane repeat protein/parallel beta-helix repeat protein
LYCIDSSPEITGCTFDGNTSTKYGGGIYAIGCDFTISKSTLIGNTAQQKGAGFYLESSDSKINQCDIRENEAPEGGGIYLAKSPSNMSVINCDISLNTVSTNGGAIYFDSGISTITNSTITANSAINHGGGIFHSIFAVVTIINSILWEDSPEEIWGSGSVTITYSDVEGGASGDRNIDANPMFVNPVIDHRLGAGSQCINAGSNDAPALPLVDKDDNPRIHDDIVDMGAYEYLGPAEPVVDIKANGKDGPLVVSPSDNVNITVFLDPGSIQDVNCDWWVAGLTTLGTYWLNPSLIWEKSDNPISVVQAPLSDLSTTSLLNTPLPVGVYTFFLIVDNSPDGNFNLTSGGLWGDYLNLFSIADGTQSDANIDLDSVLQGPSTLSLEN